MLPLSVLPTKARSKLARWQAAVEDGSALLSSLRERREAAEGAQLGAAQRLARAKKDQYADPARLKALEAEVESADAVLAQVYAEGQRRVAARDRSRYLVEVVHNWLRLLADAGGPADLFAGGAGPNWVDAEVGVKLADGETYEEAVSNTRREIYRLQADIHKLNAAPPPRDEIRQAVVDEVDRLRRAGAPRLDTSGGRVRIEWADSSQFAPSAPALSATRMLLWMFGDSIRDVLLRAVDQIGDYGLPFAERAPREQELRAEIRALEMREERLIELAEEAGIFIDRRRDVDVEALLLLTPKPFETELALAAAE